MKIGVMSDVHLEFGPYEFDNDEADVLVLGGDICVASKFGPNFDKFFSDASVRFKDVIYIMGNHEHYNGDVTKTETLLRDSLSKYPNIHFLERQTVKIGDVTFVGGTMWTDANKRDDLTLMHLKSRMNDFICVKNSDKMLSRKVPVYEKNENGQSIEVGFKFKQEPARFTPTDAADEFDKFFAYVGNVVEGKHNEKFFVCSHHSPSRQSTDPMYVHDYLMNGGFSNQIDEWIMDHPQIKVWTHGHTHDPFDYMIGDTRVVCNPRGYIGYEQQAKQFKMKVVDV